ncbi:MAG TPA: helix-turn-helix domain-containing protein [Lachnospiraceae bacterium]|nr:helix-turn-helix domain-containing protein [Lachnospiraceae bacterium]
MAEKMSLKKSLEDLCKATGLHFTLDAEDAEDEELAAEKIALIADAYREKNSKTNFIRSLLCGKLDEAETYAMAARFHVPTDESRAIYVIETQTVNDENSFNVLKQLFLTKTHDFALQMDEKRLALIKSLHEKDTDSEMKATAHTIVDMLAAEAMSGVRVGYSREIFGLLKMPQAYREARLSLEVGRIFYTNESVIRYERLGIGRLVYELPTETCRLFLDEVFGGRMPDSFDEETTTTINTFFDNNLNISETARLLYVHRNTLVYRLEKLHQATGLDIRVFDDAMTFKIASMVAGYLKDKEEKDNETV